MQLCSCPWVSDTIRSVGSLPKWGGAFMRTTRGRAICCLFAAVTLAGCATAPPNDPLAAANAHFTNTVATGAAVGCVLGGVLGAVLDSNNRAAGAAMGCGAAGAVGGLTGYAVARNNAAQAHTEADLNADIAHASNDTAYAQKAAAEAWQQTYRARAETASLAARLHDGQISQSDYQAKLAGYRQSSAQMRSLIQHIDQREEAYRADARYATPAQAEQLNHAAGQLDSARVNLKDSYAAMQQALAERPAA